MPLYFGHQKCGGVNTDVSIKRSAVNLPELDNPADPSKILEGYEAVDENGEILVGSIPSIDLATPNIGIDASGLITASVTQNRGYTEGGTEISTKQLTTQSATTIIPSATQQVAVSKGTYATGDIKVAAIPDEYITTTDATATADSILKDQTAYVDGEKVVGTMPNNGSITKTLSTDVEENKTFTIPEGYHDGTGYVRIISEVGSGTPTKEETYVFPSAGNVLEWVAIDPIPDEYITTTDATATANKILDGETAYVNGEKVTGSMVDNGAVSKQLDTSTASYTIPEGYHNGSGKVSITTETKTVTPTTSQQTVTPTSGKVLSSVTVNAMPSATQATPSITVDANGKITASTTQSAGYVTAGTKSATKQLTTKAATTVTPSTSQQTVVGAGTYVTGDIKVAAMPTTTQATPSVTVDANGLITASATQSAGYVNGGTKSATKQLDVQAAKTITPSTTSQTAVAKGVYTTGAVTVNPIPSNYKDTSDATATEGVVGLGETFYAGGTKKTGTFTIEPEVTEQEDLITQIQSALEAKLAIGSGVNITFKNCSVTDDGNGNVVITREGA